MTEEPWGVWAQLALNLMSVAFFISIWVHLQYWFVRRLRPARHAAFGLVMGLGAVVSMMLSVRFAPGIIFDLRAPLIAIAGFFGGPLGGLIAGILSGAFRAWVGGPGMIAGLTSIGLAGCIGAGGYLLKSRQGRARDVVILAIVVGATVALSFLALPNSVLSEAASTSMAPVVLLSSLATFVAGLAIHQTRRLAAESQLLRAAISQAPDYLYVKNTDSEFIAVNKRVAQHNGYSRPEDMVGKTDFDIATPDRATELLAQEQKLLSTGVPILNLEEHFSQGGEETWFVTSKVPVHDDEGHIIGIAGATRDISQSRKLERDLIDNRNLLSFATAEMADGLAMFNRAGYLQFSNERYRSAFPLTADVRKEGAHIRTILEEVVRTGEQVDLGGLLPNDWIDMVEASLKNGGEEQVHLYDGRWLHLRTRPTESGASMVVVSDVTSLKQSEEKLLSLTSELRVLASTDGLTGLKNRRSFDESLELELKKAGEAGTPLSLLMVDVDHFKAYNDLYGHPAGDECLRVVGECLKLAVRRTDDIVARYGGEEFAAILPFTSEDDSFQVAERVRRGLADLALPHAGSPLNIVTVSIGIATYPEGRTLARSTPQLIARADEALYEAKSAGRNRTMGWSMRNEHRSAGKRA